MGFPNPFGKKEAAIAIGAITGGPIGASVAAVTTTVKEREQKKFEREQQKIIEQRRRQIMEFRDTDILGRTSGNIISSGSQLRQANSGFGSGFGSFLSDVGSNIISPLSGIFSSVRPFISQQSAGQPAIPTGSTSGGRESAFSGSSEAFIGGAGNLLGQAARFLRTPAGQIGTGLAGGIGASMLSGGNGGMRITRKMKSQYRAVLNLAQGDYDQAASMIGVSTDMFIMVLLKRFRNDGPVVTKAALRKTKTTVRRLKSMCDMYDSLRPAATRRKAPMKRATSRS
jgi:hypothetical protein